ncbi:MAG: isoprenylcysteine carboxylmethyltransferase family protein [Candidatus Altiarchaeota archaeon]
MSLIGRAPINPVVFASGKLALYAALFSMMLQAGGVNARTAHVPESLSSLAVFGAAFGVAIILAGILHLGDSTRFGLPTEETRLKTGGLYRFSRNPIYLGFYIWTISAITYTLNPAVTLLGLYGMLVHHRIVLTEEKFLEKRFGADYEDYRRKVGRYI